MPSKSKQLMGNCCADGQQRHHKQVIWGAPAPERWLDGQIERVRAFRKCALTSQHEALWRPGMSTPLTWTAGPRGGTTSSRNFQRQRSKSHSGELVLTMSPCHSELLVMGGSEGNQASRLIHPGAEPDRKPDHSEEAAFPGSQRPLSSA